MPKMKKLQIVKTCSEDGEVQPRLEEIEIGEGIKNKISYASESPLILRRS
jgi:hypothetical protein